MKFKVSAEILKGLVDKSSKILDKTVRGTVRDNIKFTLTADSLRSVVVNDSVSLSDRINIVECDIQNGEEFSFLIKADTLISFIGSKKCYLEITLFDNKEIRFDYPRGSYSDTWEQADLFPNLFLPNESNYKTTVKSGNFVSVLKKAFSFIGDDEYRPMMQRVLLDIKEDRFNIATSNMFMLFKNEYMVDVLNEYTSQMVFSRNAFDILYSYLSDSDDVDINIHFDGVRQYLCFNDTIITDMALEGNYPAYEKIFNRFESALMVEVNRRDFITMISSSNMVCDDKNHILLDVEIDDVVRISAENLLNRKKIKEDIDCVKLFGEKGVFKISSRNLLIPARNISGSKMVIELSKDDLLVRITNPDCKSETIICSTFR